MGGMCFEEDGEVDDSEDSEESGGDGGEKEEKPKSKRDTGLQSALVAERKARQELQGRLDRIEADAKKAREAEKKKRGEYEGLYTESQAKLQAQAAELDTLRAEKTTRIEALKASNAERLAKLPEDWRDLADPEADPSKLARQLTRLEKRAGVAETRPAGAPQSKPPKKGSEHIPERYRQEVATMAARFGLKPETYWRIRMKPRLIKAGKIEK